MKEFFIILFLVYCASAFDVEIESFQADPKYADTGAVNYGSLRVTKRAKNTYTVSGNFEIQKNFGAEISVIKISQIEAIFIN